MSDKYFADVIFDVWMRGGNPDAVSRDRVEACEGNGAPYEEIASLELQLQHARAQVARDIARLEAGESL